MQDVIFPGFNDWRGAAARPLGTVRVLPARKARTPLGDGVGGRFIRFGLALVPWSATVALFLLL